MLALTLGRLGLWCACESEGGGGGCAAAAAAGGSRHGKHGKGKGHGHGHEGRRGKRLLRGQGNGATPPLQSKMHPRCGSRKDRVNELTDEVDERKRERARKPWQTRPTWLEVVQSDQLKSDHGHSQASTMNFQASFRITILYVHTVHTQFLSCECTVCTISGFYASRAPRTRTVCTVSICTPPYVQEVKKSQSKSPGFQGDQPWKARASRV